MNRVTLNLSRTALTVLAITGLLKLISATGSAHILDVNDQILGIPFRRVFWIAGTTEVLAGLCCLVPRYQRWGPAILAGFSMAFLSYRIVGLLTGVNSFCPCLGSATEWWPWLGTHQHSVTLTLAIWMGLVACISVFAEDIARKFRNLSLNHA
jgi:hypothetical protein